MVQYFKESYSSKQVHIKQNILIIFASRST